MKKIISIILYTLITIQLFSQTAYKNFQKYQYFRQRLRDDFVIVDSTNRQGTNIPASSRNRWGGWLEYTENPMIESFLPYMELLATEYAVNKKYGLDNTRTLNELSYLLFKTIREYIRPANSLDIDFSELPNNLYFLIIENNNKIYTEKIIKK